MTDIDKLAEEAVEKHDGVFDLRAMLRLDAYQTERLTSVCRSLWAAGRAAGIQFALLPPPVDPETGVINPRPITAVPRALNPEAWGQTQGAALGRAIQPADRAKTPLIVEYAAPAVLPAAEPTPEEEAENQDQNHGEDGR